METLTISNRQAWREWLAAHHATQSEIWLVYYKVKSGMQSIPYEASVEEALCFGWIDSLIKKWMRTVTPENLPRRKRIANGPLPTFDASKRCLRLV